MQECLGPWSWCVLPHPLPTLRAAFSGLVLALAAKVYDAVFRDRSTGPLLNTMTFKLYSLVTRFSAIAVHVRAGTLRKPPKRRAGATRVVASPRKPSLLPTRFQWLGRMTWETGHYAGRLDQVVRTDLEIIALLTAAPQAKGILRSLFWMLGRPLPDILRRPKAAPRPRAVKVRPVREPIPPDTGRYPYRPSANWPKGCVTRHPRAPAKPRSTAGPPSKA